MNRSLLAFSTCLLICTSCASFGRRGEEGSQETEAQKIERLQNQNKELTVALQGLTSRIEGLQSKLTSMSEALESTRGRVDNLVGNQKAKPAPVQTVPSEGAVRLPPAGEEEAEASFTSDDAVRRYRQAMILFESHNYPEAILGFSSFVEQYPDHALAGSAQYYLGESYFKQKEYKLAARELQRVITTYDRSPHIADTLKDLAAAEDFIGQKDEAERHRQLLLSLFPHSPAAAQASEASSEPVGAESADETETPVRGAVKILQENASPEASAPDAGLDAPPPTAPMAPSGAAESGTEHSQ